jgi:hypothetical protein
VSGAKAATKSGGADSIDRYRFIVLKMLRIFCAVAASWRRVCRAHDGFRAVKPNAVLAGCFRRQIRQEPVWSKYLKLLVLPDRIELE